MSTGKPVENVDGPNSPISLASFLKNHDEGKPLTLLVDGTGLGIAKDAQDCIYITPEECAIQSTYYSKNVFDGKRIPAYLYRYVSYMFDDSAPWYDTDQQLAEAFQLGAITFESETYKSVLGLVKWCDTNKEAGQVIGLIQLIAGSLNMAKKEKKGIRIYLEHPETSLHPKRCSRAMSMIMKLINEYGPPAVKLED